MCGIIFREALELLEIKTDEVPRMANWELLTLAKLMKKMKLNFWDNVLQEFVTIRKKKRWQDIKPPQIRP